MGRKKSRFYKTDGPKNQQVADSNAEIILPTDCTGGGVMPAKIDPLLVGPDRAGKRAKEFEKFVAKKLKKEERPVLFQRLQELSFDTNKLMSTKNLVNTDMRLKQKEREKGPKVEVQVSASNGPSSYEQLHGSKPLKVFTAAAPQKPTESLHLSESEDEADVQAEKSKQPEEPASSKPAFFVLVNRNEEVEAKRALLPVYSEEQTIMDSIRSNLVTLICGETGSGKTTQVPQFLFEAGYGHPDSDNPGMVAVTQPRRVAAISTAARVQYELGAVSEDGKPFVGHQIRFDSAVGPQTRVKFVTDGVLLREISTDFLLNKYSVVVLDEAHERNINTDILIGMLSRIVRLRADLHKQGQARPLRLVIMSATLNVDEFMKPRLFDPLPPIIKINARQHPVSMHFARRTNLEHVEAAFKMICKIHANLPPGGILVFLTGKQEIIELTKLLNKKYPAAFAQQSKKTEPVVEGLDENGDGFEAEEDTISDVEEPEPGHEEDDFSGSEFELDAETQSPLHILPLHSLLAPEQQQKVFEAPPEGSRLCVLATNVAETSITIPNIKYVIDSGKVKQRVFNLETGSQRYEVVWCSKASAAQRAGRAGRTGPGHCYRLYSTAVFDQQFPEFAQPEIQRVPIENLLLQLKMMGVDNARNFPLPSEPDQAAVEAAEVNLTNLKALITSVDGKGQSHLKISNLGTLMSMLPLLPRWSRLLVLCCQDSQDGVLRKSHTVALVTGLVATLAVGDPFLEANNMLEQQQFDGPSLSKQGFAGKPASSDLLAVLSIFLTFINTPIAERESFCCRAKVMKKKLEEMWLQYGQLRSILGQMFPGLKFESLPSAIDRDSRDYMRKSICESLCDRIAERVKIAGLKSTLPAYRLLSAASQEEQPLDPEKPDPSIVFLHSSSVLLASPPRYVAFTESTATEKGVFIKNVTVVDQAWIPDQPHQ